MSTIGVVGVLQALKKTTTTTINNNARMFFIFINNLNKYSSLYN